MPKVSGLLWETKPFASVDTVGRTLLSVLLVEVILGGTLVAGAIASVALGFNTGYITPLLRHSTTGKFNSPLLT
eukprot:4802781-Pyramimonas_sp.AAC.1